MVVFSAEMHWIGSSLGKVCVHLWDVLVVLDFFIDLMFIQWESLRKHSLFSVDCDVNNARNGMLEAHVLIFFSGQHALDPARDSCLWRSWAWPGLKLPPLTGLKCLKLAFLKFKFRFNSAAL